MTESTQRDPLPPELQSQVNILNARITNVNLANADLLREVDSTLKTMATIIDSLRKENAELKATNKKTSKS